MYNVNINGVIISTQQPSCVGVLHSEVGLDIVAASPPLGSSGFSEPSLLESFKNIFLLCVVKRVEHLIKYN